MALSTTYNLNPVSPVQITREEYTDVGSGAFQLGTAARNFLTGTDFEIWTAASGGTQLTESTDYELSVTNTKILSKHGVTCKTRVTITNATYQTGSIFITYKVVSSETDAAYFNSLQSQINLLSASNATNNMVNLQLSNDTTDASNDLDIATGFCWDDTYTQFMKLDTALVKQIDATFAEGTNAGMMQSGQTATASSWYHVYLISKTDGTTDVQCTIYSTAFVLPSGYSYKRRIGCIYYTAGSIIRQFKHTWQDKHFIWDEKTIVPDWQVPTTATLTAMDVPLGIETKPLGLFSTGVASSGGGLVFNIYAYDINPPTLVWASAGKSTFNGTVSNNDQTEGGADVFSIANIKANTSGQIYFQRHASSVYYSTGFNSTLQTDGWVDFTL